jgi:predicted ester cyclase
LAGTHQGEYCGVRANGKPVCFEVAIFYIFGTGSDADKLVAERVYWDNEMLLRQMRGEENAPTGIGLANITGQSASAGN